MKKYAIIFLAVLLVFGAGSAFACWPNCSYDYGSVNGSSNQVMGFDIQEYPTAVTTSDFGVQNIQGSGSVSGGMGNQVELAGSLFQTEKYKLPLSGGPGFSAELAGNNAMYAGLHGLAANYGNFSGKVYNLSFGSMGISQDGPAGFSSFTSNSISQTLNGQLNADPKIELSVYAARSGVVSLNAATPYGSASQFTATNFSSSLNGAGQIKGGSLNISGSNDLGASSKISTNQQVSGAPGYFGVTAISDASANIYAVSSGCGAGGNMNGSISQAWTNKMNLPTVQISQSGSSFVSVKTAPGWLITN